MIKEDPYRIKLEKLQPWTLLIFRAIKKDLKNDHLMKTPAFAQKHFPKRALDKLTDEEFTAAYMKEIAEGDEDLGEKVAARWVMKNAELYQFFATELSKINPKFDEIETLSAESSAMLLNGSLGKFGAVATYIFCVINAVVLSEEQLMKLRELALAESASEKPAEQKLAFASIDDVHAHYLKEIRKLSEKHESKMMGLERKYIQDVEGLKKQISQLHRKMSVCSG